jgi:hypothetical protein
VLYWLVQGPQQRLRRYLKYQLLSLSKFLSMLLLPGVPSIASGAELDKRANYYGLVREMCMDGVTTDGGDCTLWVENDASLRQRLIDEIRKWCSRNYFILEMEACEKS